MPRMLFPVVAIAIAAAPLKLFADDVAASADTHQLRYRFTEREEFRYRVDDERRIEVQVGETGDVVRYASETNRRHHVKHVDENGNASIEITILRVRMTAESGSDVIEFDSDVDEVPPPEFRGVLETIGNPLGLVTITPRGEVTDTELLIPTQNAGEFEAAQRDLLPTLPESPVAVGATWREPFEVDILVSLDQQLKKRVRLERVYSLESVVDGIATIAVRTIVLSPVEDGFQQGQLIQRTTHGTVQLDIDRGLLVNRTLTLDNTVIGFQGPQTSLAVEGSHEDALIPEPDVAAQESHPVR